MGVRRPFVFALLAVIVIGVPIAFVLPRAGAPTPMVVSEQAPVAASLAHVSTPGWLAAIRVVVPPGRAGVYGNPSVACTGPGDCVVVGASVGAAGAPMPMFATETRGLWGPARAVMAPTDAARSETYQLAVLQSVACQSVGDCIAVGSYTNTKHVAEPMTVSETHGVWGRALAVKLPASADTERGGLPVGLSSLACTSTGYCEAIVDYNSSTVDAAPTVATETAGVWGKASHIAAPAGTSIAALGSLACTARGECVAVGEANNRPMLAVQTHGVWAPARTVAPPLGVRFTSNEGFGHLFAVTCPTAGNCVAVGNYAASNGSGAMAISEVRSVWRHAQRITLPANASNARRRSLGLPPLLLSVACTRPGSCVAVGTYSNADVDLGADGLPVAAEETNGDWRRALQLNLPNDATASPPQTSWLTSVACPDRAECVAAGFYLAADQQNQAMLLTRQKH